MLCQSICIWRAGVDNEVVAEGDLVEVWQLPLDANDPDHAVSHQQLAIGTGCLMAEGGCAGHRDILLAGDRAALEFVTVRGHSAVEDADHDGDLMGGVAVSKSCSHGSGPNHMHSPMYDSWVDQSLGYESLHATLSPNSWRGSPARFSQLAGSWNAVAASISQAGPYNPLVARWPPGKRSASQD